MVDPGSDDSMDQNGSFVRPYVSRSGPHGADGEQFWSEDLEDAADRRSPEDGGGDLLSNEWRRKADRERVGGEDAAAHDALGSGELHDEWGERGRGEAGGDWDGRDHSRDGDWDGRDDSRGDWDARRDATDEWEATGEWDAADMRGDDPEGRRRYDDGGAEPSGFLGSGWRDGARPGEVPESGRKSVLLRAGVVAAVVVGAIWALAAWVGQPSATPCPSGGCEAKPAATAKATVVPVDDPATTEEADPGDVLTPVSTATPKSTPRTTASPSATVTKAPASHTPTATPTATHAATPAAPKPTPTPKPTRTTATPTPTPPGDDDDDDDDGGLFGWLF
ncbi:hypothetical protein [Planotetraspora kaengkrachanensis]|uniref:Uncharacterized protein n=1 Tax=Planotetraspora kaengkrachanensis TaxID=575193 RepID=A0A8J3V6P7_9ACTN|nr:hypothetical protein [Planotetraspora kaengkrachanensis]GIG81221.1 hypothetical protein Pka01_43480 [Planotetraspora kaengkrachanensis]